MGFIRYDADETFMDGSELKDKFGEGELNVLRRNKWMSNE